MAKICKVLLVEDQREIQDLLRELFASEGYRFTIVGDGAATRQAIEADPAIDVVVIDLLLPGGVDGLTLAVEACARGLPVILVTGDHTQVDGIKATGHPYLLKPFALADFVTLIDEVLRTSAAQCERDAPDARGKKVVAQVAAARGGASQPLGARAAGTLAEGSVAIVTLPRRRSSLFSRFGRALRLSWGGRGAARPDL